MALLLVGAVSAAGDEVEFLRGKSVRGHLRRGAESSFINTFGSSAAEMTLGVMEVPTANVLRVVPWPAEDAFQSRVDAGVARDSPTRGEWILEAKQAKLPAWVERLALESLLESPADAAARAALPLKRRDIAPALLWPPLDAPRQRVWSAAIYLDDPATRVAAVERLLGTAANAGVPSRGWVERAARAWTTPTGVLDADRVASYVPPDAHPLDPRPLVLLLHGALPAERGAPVLSSGREVVPIVLEEARARRWFVLAPSAVEGPSWQAAANLAAIDAALTSFSSLHAVDLERVHVAGIGEGAAGAYALAQRRPKLFATIAGASGPPPPAIATVASGDAALYIQHGARDERMPVVPVRTAAETLRKRNLDFIYCELPEGGFGWHPSSVRDWAQAIAPKRRRDAASAFPRSSLDEGNELAESVSPSAWRAAVERGSLDAAWSAARWGKEGPAPAGEGEEGDVARVLGWLRDSGRSASGRALACHLLGAWRVADAAMPLGDALRSANEDEVATAAARALARLAARETGNDVAFAMRRAVKPPWGPLERKIPYRTYQRTAAKLHALVEALGRCAGPNDALGDVEEAVVMGLWAALPRVAADARFAQEPLADAGRVLVAAARTYRTLGAPRTLTDMLLQRTRAHVALRAEIAAAATQGWR